MPTRSPPLLHTLGKSLVSSLPSGRRFLENHQRLKESEAALTAQVQAVEAALAETEGALTETQAALAEQRRQGEAQAAAAQKLQEEIEAATAREIQKAAAQHQPLLTGNLEINHNISLHVSGIALAPDGLAGALRFFINGRPFDDVQFPVPDDTTRARFTQIDGAGGFLAVATRDLAALNQDRFFRIDASPTGAYVEHNWRHAMWFMNPAHEGFPMPPAENIRRVIGDESPARFSMGGATVFHKIGAYLREMGRAWSDFPAILDWGCGAGRISRYLISETGAAVTGADIDGGNIEWCRANLTGGQFVRVPLAPPTPLPPGAFDLVIGTSVMTHLTEPMQFAWLDELRRVTRPGALLFLSVGGPVQFAYLGISPALYRRTQAAGFLDAARDPALDGHIEDADYYRSTWHSRRYIAQTWSRYFDVLAIVDGIAALQDFVVLRRR